MSSYTRRLDRVEERYQPQEESPFRFPAWLDPWADALTIEDMEVLEAGGEIVESGGAPDDLPPDIRSRYDELIAGYQAFCAEHDPALQR